MITPTLYPDVNALLDQLLANVRQILGSNFVGMYLYGSLALGDFHTGRSDVDFCVVTEQPLTDAEFDALRAMHERLAASGNPWAVELEGAYLSRAQVRRHDPGRARMPHLDRGKGEQLLIRPFDSDWVIQRHSLREYGVTLAGPPPATLIDPVAPDEMRAAVREILYDWWEPMTDPADTRLDPPGYRMYAIMTMARMLYTLENGTIVSKPVASRWAQQKFGEPWASLIDRALAFPQDDQSGNRDLTREWIRFTVDYSRVQVS